MELSKKIIPQHLLEEIVNGEKNISDYYDTYGKEELEAAVKELEKDNAEILKQYPAESMKAAILFKQKRKLPLHKIIFAVSSMAAALVVLMGVSFMLNNTSNEGFSEKPGISSTERIKGTEAAKTEPKIYMYRKEGSQVTKLASGTKAQEGDCVQISYKKGNQNYGYIFSVDGNGCITHHLPAEGYEAQTLDSSEVETALDFSYELDNAPGYECFVFVTSDKPFTLKSEEELEKQVNLKKLKEIQKGNYLPAETCFTTFVLTK